MQNKTLLRNALLTVRNDLASDVRASWDAAIGNLLIDWLQAHRVHTLGVYWPIRSEPDLRMIYPILTARGVQLALPAVVEKERPLKFRTWATGDALTKDLMGVPTPLVDSGEVTPDAILIPCVGFNPAMMRLGYGGGYYDRTLAMRPRPLAIGIAYGCASAAFETAPHDVVLDVIITESAIASIV